jgi:hypothetical protein
MSPSLTYQPPFATVKVHSTGPAPRLTAWLPATRVVFGEIARLSAELVDSAGAPIEPRTLKAIIRPVGHPELSFEQNLEPSAQSSRYSTEFLIDRARLGALHRPHSAPIPIEYRVQATGGAGDQAFEREAYGAFFIHEAGARLVAGSATVKQERAGHDVDLVLQVTVEVAKKGQYWAGAELWADEKPVAQSQLLLGLLQPGEYPVSLLFGGQVLRDSGLDGPYTVHNVRLRQVDSIPPQEADPIAELEETQAFQSTDFN